MEHICRACHKTDFFRWVSTTPYYYAVEENRRGYSPASWITEVSLVSLVAAAMRIHGIVDFQRLFISINHISRIKDKHTRSSIPINHRRKRTLLSPRRRNTENRLHLTRPLFIPSLNPIQQSHPTIDVRIAIKIMTRHARRVMMFRCPKNNTHCLCAEVNRVIGVSVKIGLGGEEELRCLVRTHRFGSPVVDGDDGFFFGDETTADVHSGKAPK